MQSSLFESRDSRLFDPRLQQLPLKVLKRYEHLLQKRYNALARRMFMVFLAVNYNRKPHSKNPNYLNGLGGD